MAVRTQRMTLLPTRGAVIDLGGGANGRLLVELSCWGETLPRTGRPAGLSGEISRDSARIYLKLVSQTDLTVGVIDVVI